MPESTICAWFLDLRSSARHPRHRPPSIFDVHSPPFRGKAMRLQRVKMRVRPIRHIWRGNSMTTYSAADTSIEQLKTKIQQRQARIGIIGMGYVGLPLALLYSEQKFRVTGFDIDARKVDSLTKGSSYIYRIAAEEIQSAQTHGFTATSDYSQISDMDAVIICVPTPLNEYHEPDLSFITDTTHS